MSCRDKYLLEERDGQGEERELCRLLAARMLSSPSRSLVSSLLLLSGRQESLPVLRRARCLSASCRPRLRSSYSDPFVLGKEVFWDGVGDGWAGPSRAPPR